MNTPFMVGSILAGKYRIDDVLGAGGMGYVFAATHVLLNERVAIKVLHPTLFREDGIRSRFLQEARAAAKIRGEHIVRVRDTDILEDGTPYLVMEYLEGHDLEQLVSERGPMPFKLAVECVLQVCQALAEAHFVGIVHRDIKPANIFLTERPDGSPLIKVLDFGISKIISDADGSVNLTKTAEIRGSPLFMSPEQMRRPKEVDGRSDVWSLGVTLFYLVSGSFPFYSENTLDLCLMVLQEKPVPLRAKRADAAPGLERVIGRCLQKNVSDRYANVAEFAAALAEFGAPSAQESARRVERILSGMSTRRASRASMIPGVGELPPPPSPPSAIAETSKAMSVANAPVEGVPGAQTDDVSQTLPLVRRRWAERRVMVPAAGSLLLLVVLVLWMGTGGDGGPDVLVLEGRIPSMPKAAAVSVQHADVGNGEVFEGPDAGAADGGGNAGQAPARAPVVKKPFRKGFGLGGR